LYKNSQKFMRKISTSKTLLGNDVHNDHSQSNNNAVI
jgi:hypothetical protein